MSKMTHGKLDFMARQKNTKKIIITQTLFKIKIQISSNIGKSNKKEVKINKENEQ